VREPSALPEELDALSVEAIQGAVKSGRLPMARVEDAYRHAQTLKARLQSIAANRRAAALGRDAAPKMAGAE
jgi:hypothetical protein